MKSNIAFIYIATGGEPERDHACIDTPSVKMTVVGVSSYHQAAIVACRLVSQGCEVIELCAGFGHEGVAEVSRAVNGRVPVGVVRFDTHPLFDGKSGDQL